MDGQITERPAAPVFVGGTGRSGTTVTARLLGAHPLLAMTPVELRVHVQPMGLADLLEDRASLADFERKARTRWFRRRREDGSAAGLHLLMEEDAYVRVIDRFVSAFPAAPAAACAALMEDLAAPAVTPPALDFVEHSPPNMTVAPALIRMFPEARFVHSVRDGRDVACSFATRTWAPDTPEEALRFWTMRMRAATAALARIEPGRVMTLQFERLLADGEDCVRTLLEFLDLPDAASPYAAVPREVVADEANVGRWRRDVPQERRAAFNRLYTAALESLRRDGVALVVPDDAADLPLIEIEAGVEAQAAYEQAYRGGITPGELTT